MSKSSEMTKADRPLVGALRHNLPDPLPAKGKFEYIGDWPDEPKAAVVSAIEGLEWLVPAWCQSFVIRWEPVPAEGTDGTDSASCCISYEYRWATVTIRPCFLSSPIPERREAMIHELLHVFIGPLAEYAETMVDRLLKEDSPKFHAATREELRIRNEGATQDLAHAISKVLDRED